MADELFEDIERRLSSLDRGMDDGRRRRDNIEAEYHEEKRRIEQERSEAQALRAALLAKGRDEEAGRAAAAGEIERCKRELRDLEDEHAQRQTSWQRRRKELDAMLARVPEKYAGLPVREQDRRRVEQMSDEEVLAVIDRANDGSFWAMVRRLFRIGGAMRQGEAASLVKAFVENVRGRLVLEESAHEHRYRAFCDGLNKKIDRQRAVQDSLRTSDKIPELGVFDKRLRALKASYEEKLAALSRTPSFEPGPVLAECRRMSQEAVARLGCADTGAYRPPREFPSQTPIGLVEARGGGNKLCVPYSFDWKRLQGVWFSVDRDLAKAQEWVRSIVGCAVRRAPRGNLKIYWVDAANAGISLGVFGDVASRIESADDTLVKIASTEDDTGRMVEYIKERFGKIGPTVAKYGSLWSYNAAPETMAVIPQIIVVVNDLTNSQYGSYVVDAIGTIMQNAATLGTQLLVISSREPRGEERFDEAVAKVRSKFTVIEERWNPGASRASYELEIEGFGPRPILPLNPDLASSGLVAGILNTPRVQGGASQSASEAGSVEEGVSQSALEVNLSAVPVCDVAEGVDIPFGTTELGAPAVLHLGTTPVHGIVTGTTGTGKTTFFKNAIESICTHYSPNDVELWLVDYKRSDFALYKQPEHHFPHIGFLGFDTSSDFIRAFSRKLVKEMEDRQEKTVETKTTGINSYNRYVAEHPESGRERMRRLIVIIDEFHAQALEMTASGSRVVDEFSKVVAEGRAYGMHLLISNQALSSENMTA